jgi:transcriptional regulator with XRE-family HTH domain
MRRNANLIGPNVVKFRCLRGWTQEELAGKIQLAGCYMTRDMLANIETRRRTVTDVQADFIADVFGISTAELFPPKPRGGARRRD